MSHPDKDRIEHVFATAQGLEGEAREAYLRRECADDDVLREEVDALLVAARESESYFDKLIGQVSAAALVDRAERAHDLEASEARVGDEVGPYTLVALVGIGGMGEVWKAQRTDRLIERFIALKLPHGTWQRRGLAERMARERAILGTLDHPNIARLLDTGVTERGQPYLAIEYVEGTTIDVYCATHELDIPARLRLFLQVVDAVAYAHGKLIVHRDLKPQNILVTTEGRVRLLDFGIAKLVAPEPTPESSLTLVAGRALTPDYAAPEQITGEAVTVAVDVYSLGVILYELLTGQKPYKLPQPSRGALEEAIVNTDATVPSRSTSDEVTRRTLRGDLDTIVLKALKKDPSERYATANALADDIVRYLDRRPVLAQPDSALYRTGKFVQRHRAGVIGATGLAVALIGATGVSLRYAQVTAEHAQRISLERERADSIKQFVIDMLKSADPNLTAADMTVKAVVQEKFATIKDSFNDDPATKVELLQVFADVFEVLRLSELQKDALEMQLALLAKEPGRNSLAYAQALAHRARAEEKLGDYSAAFATVNDALEINTALNHAPGIAENYHQLGLLHHLKGEHTQAESLYQQALSIRRAEFGEDGLEFADTLYELGVLYDELARNAEAETYLRRALATRERLLGERHTEVAEAIMALGTNLSRQRRLEEAIATNERAFQLYEAMFGPDNRYSYLVVNNLGHDYWRQGDLARAKTQFEKTLQLARKFYPGHPDEGIALVNLSDLAYDMKDRASALELYRASLAIFEAHMPEHPKIHMIRLRIGVCLGGLGQYEEAEKFFEPAFLAVERAPVYNKVTVQRAARAIIDIYSAWGRTDKIPFYRSFAGEGN